MGLFRPSLPFIMLVLVLIVFSVQKPRVAEARPLALQPQQRYSKILATLGMVCKCCDGAGGECTNVSNVESCGSKLQCLPWKLY